LIAVISAKNIRAIGSIERGRKSGKEGEKEKKKQNQQKLKEK
jgi:hypothetical protein